MKDYRKAADDYKMAYQVKPEDNDARVRAMAEESLLVTPTPTPSPIQCPRSSSPHIVHNR